MKSIEHYFFTFMAGFLVATLVCLSMKYPFKLDSIDKYKGLCPSSTIESVKVGLSGDIYHITCANGYQTKVN